MAHWYYKGKTTAAINHPQKGPQVLTPRTRFEAPQASVQHLLNADLVTRVPDPSPEPPSELETVKGAEETSGVQTSAPSKSVADPTKGAKGASKSEASGGTTLASSSQESAQEEKEETSSSAHRAKDVVASGAETIEEAGEGATEDVSSSESKEQETSKSTRKSRRRRSRRDGDDG